MRQRWEADELVEFWTLSDADWSMVGQRSGAARLGFALVLKFHEIAGRFPSHWGEVPLAAVSYVATQVGVNPHELVGCPITGTDVEEFRRAVSTRTDSVLAGELAARDPDATYRQEVLARLAEAANSLDALTEDPRAVAALQEDVEPLTYESLFRDLDQLALVQAFGMSQGVLPELAAPPGTTSLEAVFARLEHLCWLRALEVPVDVFEGVPDDVVRGWSARAARSSISELRSEPPDVRTALLAALCWTRQADATESLVDLLVALIDRLRARAEGRLAHEPAVEPCPVRDKDEILVQLAEAALQHPDETIRTALHPVISPSTLRALVREERCTDRDQRRRRHRAALRSTYSPHYQQIITPILAALEFRCSAADHWPVMAALGELQSDRTSSWGDGRFYEPDQPVAFETIVPGSWRSAVVDKWGRVERIGYQLCVLVAVRKALARGHIRIAGVRERGQPAQLPAHTLPRRAELPSAPSGAADIITWPSAEPSTF